MSYLVLARKYRPQTFEQVIGQEHVTRTLQNAIRRGRIHHAFLFCGGRGTGKTTTARILAKALSCDKAPTPEPCNVCPACVEITNGTSVDVQEIDAASQNRVEDIRELRESIRYAPVRGKKKLYILDEVHMLSTSAFNALLKTLEEPPPHALFVFATTDPHKLPQTILSRVQRYDFKLVPTGRLVEHLGDVLARESIEFDPSALYIVAREGAGSVRDSLSLLDQVLASAEGRLTEDHVAAVLGVADRRLILTLGQALAGRDPATALSLIDDAFRRGFDLPQLARTLLAHLRDLVVVSVVKEPHALLDVPASELPELELQAKAVTGRAELLFDRMMRVAEDTARAAQARYALEVGLIDLCAIEPLTPISELVERMEQLEERLVGRGGGRGGAPPSPAAGGANRGGPMSGAPSVGATAATAPAGVGWSERGKPAGEPLADPRGSVAAPRTLGPAAGSLASSPLPPPRQGEAGVETGVMHAMPMTPAAAPRSAPSAWHASPVPAVTVGAVRPQAGGTAVPAIEAVHAAVPSPANLPSPAAVETAVHAPVPPLPEVPAAVGAAAASVYPAEPPAPATPAAAEADKESAGSAGSLPQPASPGARGGDFAAVVRHVLERAPVLAYLREARVVAWADSRLVLGLPSDFFVQRAKDERARIQELMSGATGGALSLDFVLDAEAAKHTAERETVAAAEERARSAELAKRKREANEHPSLKLVREVFGEVSFMEPELEQEVIAHG